MTSEEITTLIYNELKSEKEDITNVFGLDLTKCLIEPRRELYKESNDATNTYELWTVFEENKDRTGYMIFYDEDVSMFGLALQSDTEALIDIGYYGSFLKTIYSL